MKNIFLFYVVINGSTESAYNSSIWVLSVWYDPKNNSIYTCDSFGDTDIIEFAETVSDAMQLASVFFRNDEIIRAA